MLRILKNTTIFVIIFIVESVNLLKFEGDDCVLSNGEQGKCFKIGECLKVLEELKSGTKPITCGFNDFEPIVCCELTVKTKSEEVCEIYGRKFKQLKKYSISEIEGGNDVIYNYEFPHMAALGFGTKDHIIWRCGGTLISDLFVLTAAHCLRDPSLGELKFVRIGDIRLDSTSNDVQNFETVRNIRHPNYIPPYAYNDIALIELDHPAVFSYNVRPACLYSKSLNSQLPLTTTSWSSTQYSAKRSINLQKATVHIFNYSQCAIAYSSVSNRRLPSGILEDRQVCTGSYEDVNTCGDLSGGPLQTYTFDEDIYGIVGISSFDKTCSVPDAPNVYTRLTYYIPWIESIVWPK